MGWASAKFLREDTEVLKPYSVSGAPTGPGQFVATCTAIDKTAAGDGRWKIVTQTVISNSTTPEQPNEVIVTSQLVDCRRGRSEVIHLDGIAPGSFGSIEEAPGPDYHPALAGFDEDNLWWVACRVTHRRYLWPRTIESTLSHVQKIDGLHDDAHFGNAKLRMRAVFRKRS